MKTYTDLLVGTENTWDLSDNENSYIDTQYVDGEKIEYEILFGNERIVFIKAGAGGSARGRENKYLRMARRIHERVGATVICASNPDVPHEEFDEGKIREIVAEMGLSDFEISFIGTSDGAYQNLSLAQRFSEAVKIIGINTSYIDIPDLKERLMALPDTFKLMIYGTEDEDSGEVIPMLREMECNNFELKLVDGADHSFTGMVEEFIALSDYL